MNFLKWLTDSLLGWIPYVPKAMWGMKTIEYKNETSKWHALRAFGFLGLIGWLLVWGLVFVIDTDDFSTPFPSYQELRTDSGTLKYIKYAKRQFDLGLIKPDGSNIHINSKYGLFSGIDTLYSNDDGSLNYKIEHEASIKWFLLPHGSAWIAELKKNGKIFISYYQSKKSYEEVQRHNKKWLFYTFWLPLFAFVMIIIFEASAIRKYN
jgi:hypothetical protein